MIEPKILLLMTLGAAFFAKSVNDGLAGLFRKSIIFAALAALTGILKALNEGVLERPEIEIFAVFSVNILLATLGVMGSRMFFEASSKRKQKDR